MAEGRRDGVEVRRAAGGRVAKAMTLGALDLVRTLAFS